jgi:hypothetical protein
LLAGYEERRAAFAGEGVNIIAGAVDTERQTEEVAEPLAFPVAYGVTRGDGDTIGAWWDKRRDHIQPSEFLLSKSGKVLMSTYSNSPVGRMDPGEMLTLIKFLNAQRANSR